jgi:2,3-bisphosphoglycerate-dependent phosphoglycerate mutase
MNNLILLRHGISYTNEGRHVENEQQILLTTNGVMGTLASARAFREANPELHFDHAFLSPYQRAVQTGLNFLSIAENKPINLTYVDDFRERTYGFTNFVGIKDLVEQYGSDVVTSWDSRIDTKPHPDGESQQDVYDRVIDKFQTLVLPRIRAGETVLLVAHYYVLKALNAYLNGSGPSGMIDMNPRNCVPYGFKV